MDNQPALDRTLLFPLLIGGLSVVGIIVVLLIGRALSSPLDVPVTPSATRFQFLFLGTEPAITTPTIEESEAASTEEPTEETGAITPVLLSPTSTSGSTVSTPVILTPPTLSGTQATSTPIQLGTATATLSSPVSANTYDDTDSRLAYSGNWIPRTNASGAHQGTLHVSQTAGNSVRFTFTGQEIQLFYQPDPSFGIITITFDDDTQGIPFTQTQSNGVWAYTLETSGTHTVLISHTGGGSVNIDRLVIPLATPTPTRSPTPTP